MKKSLLAFTIAVSLSLTACGNEKSIDGKVAYESYITESLKADTKIVFDILSAPILPTYLAMDSTDGTLSTEGSTDGSNYSKDLADPTTALGKVDGWSVSQPIQLPFDKEIDANSAAAAFHMIETSSPLDANFSIKKALVFGTDYILSVDGKNMTVVPLKPLNPKSNYMFALTNVLKDKNGNSVGMSESYATLKTAIQAPSDSLIDAQKVTQATEKAISAAKSVDSKSIIYSSWFSTASVGVSLATTKAVIAKTFEAIQQGKKPEDIWKGDANPNNLDLSNLFSITLPDTGVDLAAAIDNDAMLTKLVTSSTDPDGSQTKALLKATYANIVAKSNITKINVFKGAIELPHFLTTETANKAWQQTPWQSATPSLAKISHVMTKGSAEDKAALTQSLSGVNIPKLLTGDQTEFINLIGLKGKLANGDQLDDERLITQYSPLPQIKSIAKVPVLVFVPEAAGVTDKLGAVIYQHGVTSVKETAYTFAANHMAAHINSNGTLKTIVAIDHPLHGERALADGTVTTPATADVYMNLNYLNVARDNIRQSIIDDIGVRVALGKESTSSHSALSNIDVTKISFFGHSLGAITGVASFNIANQTVGNPAADQALFKFTAGAFANPGSGIPSLLLESKAFGPTIKHSLLMGAKDPSYQAACQSTTNGGQCFTEFFSKLDDTSKTTVNGTFAKFAYAAQTVLDTVDPYNHASTITDPVYVMQAYGDAVVPNQTTEFSNIGGTQPLAKLLKSGSPLDLIAGDKTGAITGIAEFSELEKAQHSSIIVPQLTDGDGNSIPLPTSVTATLKAQSQVASFSANDGQKINTSIIIPLPPMPTP
ncbi:VolA/Pla-1 family phospholipase [Photobacterium swingsii]|uniref:VolA/Pla-1 family phospholipase n=1 Tax=Photobacterium swingsii TaxID=680026 RepID=UPI004068A557